MVSEYKLFALMRTLSGGEVRKVRKLLRSPFFVHRQSTLHLFEELIKWQSKKQQEPALEWLSRRLFSDEPYDAARLRGLMSDLLELLEDWLAIDSLKSDAVGRRLQLAKIYRKRKLDKSFQSSIRKCTTLLDQYPYRNQQYYDHMLGLHEERMSYQSESKRTGDLYFQEISRNTDIGFLIRKLKNACSLLTHQSVIKTEYDFGLLDLFIDQLDGSTYLDIPVVAMYYNCFRFLKEKESLQYFQRFKQTLTDHRHLFDNEELKGPFLLGINFCIKKLNQGDKAYAREGFELYKEGLETKILLENERITRFTFSNIVAMGLVLKEYRWIGEFINDFEPFLDSVYRDPTVQFNKARLAFDRKDHGAALTHLQSVEHKDLVNNLIAKLLLVQIYFELDEMVSLESHLDSFAQFIRRREVSDFHRTNFMNIITYVRKLMSIPTFEKEKRHQLRQQIEQEEVLSVREWLLEQV